MNPGLLKVTGAIARREAISAFGTPSGWVVAAILLVPAGIVFAAATFQPGGPATLREVFQALGWSMLFVAPAITMRSISEELRQGTFELLLATPATEAGIVLGKFVGAMAQIAAALAPTALLALALELHGRPDWGELLCGWVGLLLAGGLYASSGVLFSALTTSQLVAYLSTLFFWLVVAMSARLVVQHAPPWLAAIVHGADPLARLRDFTLGLFDTAHVAFFVLATIAALAGAAIVLRARRLS
ncbi:MAG TPA: ABC transporter permease subunit [Phycisphaerales bacterium]|nr:ABC transporter permease subunit [Phycisphaerales bacterium]HMP38420.1 ABC transporter permease subunit [Phycisphaerales bacterium]